LALKFTKLTADAVRKLSYSDIAGDRTIHEHGISFERLKSGDGRWKVSVQVDGQRISRAIGMESEGVTRHQCEVFIEQKRTEAREDRLSLPKARKTGMRFSEASKEYLSSDGLKDITNKKIAMRHLDAFFGDMVLSQITVDDINVFKAKRSSETTRVGGDRKTGKGGFDRPVAPATLLRELAVLRHLFGFIVGKKWVPSMPVVKGFKPDNERLTYCTNEQIDKILEYAQVASRSPNIYPFMLLGFTTGMRMDEILEIRLENIDVDRKMIYVPHAKKGQRDQPLTPSVAEYLSQYKGQTGWLFPSDTSKTGHVVNIKKSWCTVVRAAGFDPRQVIRHTMRHSVATHATRITDLKTAQRITGHADVQSLLRYTKTNSGLVEAAMANLDALITPKLHQTENEKSPQSSGGPMNAGADDQI
jgi:integrase